MSEELNRRAKLWNGRELQPGELEDMMLRSSPAARITTLEILDKEAGEDGLSLQERSRRYSLKGRLTDIHERMLKVQR